ncbi:MAG: AAA family ATPase [Bryobacteraceae bacterium]|nr:AAA family ATPase [Bryobacteraceae bacterium]
MLTKLTIVNFKRFGKVEVELGSPVLFVGPNNSGKTSALQALALWDVGLRRWNEKRQGATAPEKRPGVTISRRDLIAVPVPDANLLWRNLHTRESSGIGSAKQTRNVRIDITLEGVTESRAWQCGLEFDYANDESFYCRPLRLSEEKGAPRMPVPDEAAAIRMAFLPPMSGLAATETKLETGAVNVRIGEGRTAEVLRNLSHAVAESDPGRWKDLCAHIHRFFGVELDAPRHIPERGEIQMTYRDRGVTLDLSSSGRGLQQTLLLLAYMYANPGAVLLLDEPDAHLEILRQRQVYQILADVARENGNQIIAASHSEVLLNEAAGRDVVVAFVGKPHRIDDRGSQVQKALREIGFEDYYQAEQTGWVLYLEGSTDLAHLRSFAKALGHQEALDVLERPFVRYVGEQPMQAVRHYQGLREASPSLKAIAVFDRLPRGLPPDFEDIGLVWRKREIENYICYPETLEAYARGSAAAAVEGPLFLPAEEERRVDAMRESIAQIEAALATLGKGSPWSPEAKVSDDFLTPLFEAYFRKLGLPNIMAKKGFHELTNFAPPEKLEPEIREKLDAIVRVARSATPAPVE